LYNVKSSEFKLASYLTKDQFLRMQFESHVPYIFYISIVHQMNPSLGDICVY